MEYYITENWADRTVKDYLYTEVGVSRSVLIRLKKREDGILLNGSHVTVRAILKAGDCLRIAIDDTNDERIGKIPPVDLPLSIAYEDEELLVLNKPYGMPTHPTHGHYEDTLANAVVYYMHKQGVMDFVFRAVNRLDRDTSGLVIVCKNQLSCAKLSASLRQGKIVKKYLALLCGIVKEECGSIDRPIRRAAESIIIRECCEKGQGDEALTLYRVLARYKEHTLVCASPITGRTHQLRVHFASMGHPILGDDLYGSPSHRISRQALHAVYLSFPHPTTKEQMSILCPVPTDVQNCMEDYIISETDIVD